MSISNIDTGRVTLGLTVLFIVEALHWTDPSTLELLNPVIE